MAVSFIKTYLDIKYQRHILRVKVFSPNRLHLWEWMFMSELIHSEARTCFLMYSVVLIFSLRAIRYDICVRFSVSDVIMCEIIKNLVRVELCLFRFSSIHLFVLCFGGKEWQ